MTDLASSESTLGASAAELRACIRDLMALFSLPARWNGEAPDAILRLLCETLEAMLPLEVCYACARVDPERPPTCVLRIRGASVAADDPAWACVVETSGQPHRGPPKMIDDSPLGGLRMVTYDMGYFGEGSVCVGSTDPAFQSPTQALVIQAAVTLAAGALQSARLLREKEEATRARERFLTVLGHELRNPLAPIVTALSLMKMRSGNRLTREQEIVDRQVAQLSQLINDVLDISRLGRGKIELRKAPMELAVAVSKAVELVKPLIEQRRHYLRVEVAPSGLLVDGDADRLAQIAANLLTNAAKYTDPGGNIALKAWRDEAEVKLCVKDNGAGLAPELLPRVFDPFLRGGPESAGKPGGLGIGLALVRAFAALHGGTISAYSDGPGQGSEFVVVLPAYVPPEMQATGGAAGAAEHAAHTERVVVVDDNRDAAELVGAVLATVGHEVSVAHDALQALSLIARFKPTVVVLDIGLPVMDGYELASRIREAFGQHSPKLIAVTGYGQEQDRQRSQEVGIHVHLVKPVDVDQLIAAVGRDAET